MSACGISNRLYAKSLEGFEKKYKERPGVISTILDAMITDPLFSVASSPSGDRRRPYLLIYKALLSSLMHYSGDPKNKDFDPVKSELLDKLIEQYRKPEKSSDQVKASDQLKAFEIISMPYILTVLTQSRSEDAASCMSICNLIARVVDFLKTGKIFELASWLHFYLYQDLGKLGERHEPYREIIRGFLKAYFPRQEAIVSAAGAGAAAGGAAFPAACATAFAPIPTFQPSMSIDPVSVACSIREHYGVITSEIVGANNRKIMFEEPSQNTQYDKFMNFLYHLINFAPDYSGLDSHLKFHTEVVIPLIPEDALCEVDLEAVAEGFEQLKLLARDQSDALVAEPPSL